MTIQKVQQSVKRVPPPVLIPSLALIVKEQDAFIHDDPFPPHAQPTTAFMLRLSKNPPRSSLRTSTTQCSKLSMRTRALVSATTS